MKRGRPSILTAQQVKEILWRYIAGETSEDLAQDYEITPRYVLKVLERSGVDRRKGEGIKARLKSLDKPRLKNQMIYQMIERGTPLKKISEIFEISESAVTERLRRYKKRFAINDL